MSFHLRLQLISSFICSNLIWTDLISSHPIPFHMSTHMLSQYISFLLISSYLIWSYISSHSTSQVTSHLILYHFISTFLTPSHFVSHPISFNLIWTDLIPTLLTSHLTSHLISSHLLTQLFSTYLEATFLISYTTGQSTYTRKQNSQSGTKGLLASDFDLFPNTTDIKATRKWSFWTFDTYLFKLLLGHFLLSIVVYFVHFICLHFSFRLLPSR